jgi:hypothetical protein
VYRPPVQYSNEVITPLDIPEYQIIQSLWAQYIEYKEGNWNHFYIDWTRKNERASLILKYLWIQRFMETKWLSWRSELSASYRELWLPLIYFLISMWCPCLFCFILFWYFVVMFLV